MLAKNPDETSSKYNKVVITNPNDIVSPVRQMFSVDKCRGEVLIGVYTNTLMTKILLFALALWNWEMLQL